MGSNQNSDVNGRLSKILNTLREISEALSPSSVEDNNRIDSIFSTIESSAFELHDLVVGKRDKDTSKDSGNTSFTEVRFVYMVVLFMIDIKETASVTQTVDWS